MTNGNQILIRSRVARVIPRRLMSDKDKQRVADWRVERCALLPRSPRNVVFGVKTLFTSRVIDEVASVINVNFSYNDFATRLMQLLRALRCIQSPRCIICRYSAFLLFYARIRRITKKRWGAPCSKSGGKSGARTFSLPTKHLAVAIFSRKKKKVNEFWKTAALRGSCDERSVKAARSRSHFWKTALSHVNRTEYWSGVYLPTRKSRPGVIKIMYSWLLLNDNKSKAVAIISRRLF